MDRVVQVMERLLSIYELRDPEQAREHVIQSLWLMRNVVPNEEAVSRALEWAIEISSEGSPLPLVGFVCDVGHIALGSLREPDAKLIDLPFIDHGDIRKYEDYVLGKLYADTAFERGADALLRFQGRDRDRGVAYLVEQFRQRAGLGGVILAPAVLKSIQDSIKNDSYEAVWYEGRQAVEADGLPEYLVEEFRDLIDGVRNTGEVLGAEDVFELESGTALEQFGQRVALRQVLQAGEFFEQSSPREKVRPLVNRPQVATHIVDEDMYPVGGYTSISTRGSIESLLFSQLSFMEPDDGDRPDLFDVKFLRDELYYYSRDENQFLRRRLTFVFAIYPDLIHARFKDSGFPWQRIILTLGMFVVVVRKMIEWLSDHALSFEFLFLNNDSPDQLDNERTLIETLLREQIANGTVIVEDVDATALASRCNEIGRRSLCHLMTVSKSDHQVEGDFFHTTRLQVDGPQPRVGINDAPLNSPEEQGLDGWLEILSLLLRAWIE